MDDARLTSTKPTVLCLVAECCEESGEVDAMRAIVHRDVAEEGSAVREVNIAAGADVHQCEVRHVLCGGLTSLMICTRWLSEVPSRQRARCRP